MKENVIEFFPVLSELGTEMKGLVHGFFLRQPEVDVDCSREEALARLKPVWENLLDLYGWGNMQLCCCEQVHGDDLAWVGNGKESEDRESGQSLIPRDEIPVADGLLTQSKNCLLGIVVADCAAVYLLDKRNQRMALVHSGKKGTEIGVVSNAVQELLAQPHARVEDLVAVISPCIAPPHYEVDIAALIIQQLAACGLKQEQISPPLENTAQNLSRYYSYRAEKGKTGRMLAVFGFQS